MKSKNYGYKKEAANINDETVEGLRYKNFKGLSVQFTPKGDIDSSTGFIIRDFYKMMDGEENA